MTISCVYTAVTFNIHNRTKLITIIQKKGAVVLHAKKFWKGKTCTA